MFSTAHSSPADERASMASDWQSQPTSSIRAPRATAGPVGPVGRRGVPVSRVRSASTVFRAVSTRAATAGGSWHSASARSASRWQARAVSPRRVLFARGGQSSITAMVPAPAASAQPASRSGMADAGAGTATDSTKTRMAAVPPAAK